MSEVIKCMIVDDEPLALELMKRHVDKITGMECVSTCNSAVEAYSQLQQLDVELLFLDINMPEMTGKELLLSMKTRPAVILTTAYREYAIESYEWDVVDYLLKPISFPRFLKAVEKYKSLSQKNIAAPQKSTAQTVDQAFIYVQENRKQVKVIFSEVTYAESMKDYVRIHTQEKGVMTKMTFADFQKKLPSEFLRIHRSFIVNKRFITAFSSHTIEVGDKELPIGISYKMEVMKSLK